MGEVQREKIDGAIFFTVIKKKLELKFKKT